MRHLIEVFGANLAFLHAWQIDQGNLYSMGWGADGQLGLGPSSSSDRALPTLIERLSWKAGGKAIGRVKEISSSTDFTLALLDNNQIWIWGNAEYGQCMVNKKIDRVTIRNQLKSCLV